VLELVAQKRVVGGERSADVLDVHALAAAREADDVGEEHGHDLALLAARHGRHGGAAAPAEPE
jgi:hypothetical protein